MKGKLIIFSAPSGSGKTSILKKLFEKGLPLEFSVSACSRPKRLGEVHGKDYYFLSTEDFRQKIENDEFLEWEEVYAGSYYGTLKSELKRIWANGNCVVFDVDVLGGVNIKKIFMNDALAIFIKPPSIKDLKNRLIGRHTETPETLKKRLDRAKMELSYAKFFDVSVVNDDLEKAVETVEKIIVDFTNKSNE